MRRTQWLVLALLAACGGVEDADPEPAEPEPVQVEFVVRVPAGTEDEPPVHIAGDFQGWDPSDPTHALQRGEDGRWAIRLELPPDGPIEYKYVRADWSRVERTESGTERANRQVAIGRSDVRFEDSVEAWADRPSAPRTLTGDVRRIDLLGRPAMVYVPPGYAESSASYPLLLMFDGQNLFDERTAFAGEWGVDESVERLIQSGEIAPILVVGLYNAGSERIHEYTPWPSPDFDPAGGGGAAYLQRVVDEALPELRRRFRITSDRAEVAISGSSLGGLMAVYAGFAHTEHFGKVAGLSPSVWWAQERLVSMVRGAASKPPIDPLVVDMGTLESGGLDGLRALSSALQGLGFQPGVELFVDEIRGAGHNEAAWRARFPSILRRLFPASK